MIVVEPKITCRIQKPISVHRYDSGGIEMMGLCNLTGKMVIRYILADDASVYEWDGGKWIPLVDGVCKDHSSDFAKVCLPNYTENLLAFKKKEIVDAQSI